MKKSVKKTALIPYLDTIEITSIEIFAKTTEIWGKTLFFVVEDFLIYDTILISGVKQQERNGGFFLYKLRKVLNDFV